MTLKDALIAQFDREVAISKRVLANVPEGKFDWKPHPKSMQLGYLAQLVAMMPVWISMVCDQPDLDLAAGNLKQEPWKTADDLLKQHDGFAAKGRASLVGASEDTIYNTNWQLKMKGAVVADDPRYQVIQDTLTHLAHHRGQLTVYLRLLEAKVASTYGPSADDNPVVPAEGRRRVGSTDRDRAGPPGPRAVRYRIAIGATVDPVPPLIFSGCTTNANSCTRSAASASSFMFSRMWMPLTTSMIWCTGSDRSGSGFGPTSTGQLSAPTSSGSCFASHSAAATPMPGHVFT